MLRGLCFVMMFVPFALLVIDPARGLAFKVEMPTPWKMLQRRLGGTLPHADYSQEASQPLLSFYGRLHA